MARQLVTDLSQVFDNIANFRPEEFIDLIGYFRSWYAVEMPSRGWVIAPSKPIGYANMNARRYRPENLSGSKTERTLQEWFVELEPGTKLETKLRQQLRLMLAQQGKTLNKLTRINVLKDERGQSRLNVRSKGNENWRITSDPNILSGKPCIRGIRIRVTDILEMLATGASREEILEDFPYLENEDITAALEYAVGTVDHRLVKAA